MTTAYRDYDMPKPELIVSIVASMSCAFLFFLPSLAASVNSKVVKELQPTIQTLGGAGCPVYLPTWIPEKNKARFSQALLNNDDDFTHGYEVSLGLQEPIANANTTFYIHGGEGHAKGKHGVKLTGGRIGFLKHALIEWNQGKYKYGIGFIDGAIPSADMIKCANSVVLIPKSK